MRGPSPSKDVRLPPLAAIQAFEAAARLGSFERASEELFVTASAIGKRIAALEALLDVSLFIRSSRGATLSSAGREYLDQVRTALDLLSDASLHKRGEPKPEPLRVVSTPTFARQVLIPYLPSFTAAHPDIELEIMLSIPYLDIMPPNADVKKTIVARSARRPDMRPSATPRTTAPTREDTMAVRCAQRGP